LAGYGVNYGPFAHADRAQRPTPKDPGELRPYG